MRIYTMIGGVNGSGKSSLTGALKAERSDLGILIDVDKINADLGGDRVAGGKKAIELMNFCIERGLSFTQETTLSGVRTERTIRRARERGYCVRLYYVGLGNVEESLRRIQNRVEKGGHAIPESDVRRRFAKRFADLLRILPYCGEAIFFDNENGFVEVGQYRNGELQQQGAAVPAWFLELIGEWKKGVVI